MGKAWFFIFILVCGFIQCLVVADGDHPFATNIFEMPIVKGGQCGFNVQPLKTIKYSYSEATDINDKGEIVGIFYNPVKLTNSAFLSLPNGDIQILELPGDEVLNVVINNRSQIAGTIHFTSLDRIKGFLFDPEEGLTIIEGLGGIDTYVRDLNDQGQVVGNSNTGVKSEVSMRLIKHAFIWENGLIKDLGTLKADYGLEGDSSDAIAINNHGEVVGMSNYSINAGGVRKLVAAKPFYWNGEMQEIPCGIEVVAINNKSNVVLNGKNQSLIWNPYQNGVTIIPSGVIADINDNDMVLFVYASYSREVSLYADGKMHNEITYTNLSPDLSFVPNIFFKKLNNSNMAVGTGIIECLNEQHAFVMKPS